MNNKGFVRVISIILILAMLVGFISVIINAF